jgi:hypothetical protein
MTQHSMTIANQPGASFRADLNSMAAALVTNNGGLTAPSPTFARMWWPDETAGILKQRNAANSGWINVLDLATGRPYATGTPSASTYLRGDSTWASVSGAVGLFNKADPQSVAFTKTGANTLSIKAGTTVDVVGTAVAFSSATALTMPTLTAGVDYAIYACQDGTVRADSSFSAPSGYSSANSRLIGGFHYGLVASGTTAAGGSFNSAGSVTTGGMVWVQGDVDKIAGINQYSLWDLKWRADVADLRAQRGFTYTDAGIWVGIYFASTDTDTNGLSKNNTDVASGTVLPKIPATMGGNGTATYADYNWWRASEHARAYGARLLTDAEACIAFFGVTENQSLGGASSTIPLTARQAGYTSKYGVEQATGHHWIWGDDSNGTPSAYVANGGRGQSYASGVYKVILGGGRGDAANSGSRTSAWNNGPTNSGWGIGLRAACDHLMLV